MHVLVRINLFHYISRKKSFDALTACGRLAYGNEIPSLHQANPLERWLYLMARI